MTKRTWIAVLLLAICACSTTRSPITRAEAVAIATEAMGAGDPESLDPEWLDADYDHEGFWYVSYTYLFSGGWLVKIDAYTGEVLEMLREPAG